MDDRRDIVLELVGRLRGAVPLAVLGWRLSAPANCGENLDAQCVTLWFAGLACILAAALVVAKPLAALVAEPVLSLFFPRHRARHEPAYSRADAIRLRGRYEDAIAAYQDIADEFPNELRPYVAMMEIALQNLGDAEFGDAIVKRGLTLLRDDPQRHELLRRRDAVKAKMAETVAPVAPDRPTGIGETTIK